LFAAGTLIFIVILLWANSVYRVAFIKFPATLLLFVVNLAVPVSSSLLISKYNLNIGVATIFLVFALNIATVLFYGARVLEATVQTKENEYTQC